MTAIKSEERLRYRPEIDGLRALAVVPVVLFHAGFPGPSGGHIGVDVFFVISGFLITSIILKDLEVGKFSFSNFYERRARRILPLLFCVLIVCLPLAWLLMTPLDLKQFGQSLSSTVLFSSNIIFWRQSGYFDLPAETKPLLHTWSLSLEEQYYIFFPMLLSLGHRYARRFLWPSILTVTALSFGIAIYAGHFYPNAAFFLLPSRGWELLLGATLAFPQIKNHLKLSVNWKQFLSVLGLVMVLASYWLFDTYSLHPGILTLLPTLGTVLLLGTADSKTWVGRFLSIPPLVGIGLISYSLYLWHQPVLVFARLYYADHLSLWASTLAIVISCILSCITWKFVEGPMRDKKTISISLLAKILITTGILLASFGAYIFFQNGIPKRFNFQVQKVLSAERSRASDLLTRDGKSCFNRSPEEACVIGAAGVQETLAVLGDSHASALTLSIDQALRKQNLAGIDFTQSGCPFAPRLWRMSGRDYVPCFDRYQLILRKLDERKISTVILAARFPLYLEGKRFDNGEGGIEQGELVRVGEVGVSPDSPIDTEFIRKSFLQAINDLIKSGKRVILVYPIPEIGRNVPRYLARAMARGETYVSSSTESYIKRSSLVNASFNTIPEGPLFARVLPQEIFCDTFLPNRCVANDDKRVFYFDSNHLTVEGADLVVQKIMQRIQ